LYQHLQSSVPALVADSLTEARVILTSLKLMHIQCCITILQFIILYNN